MQKTPQLIAHLNTLGVADVELKNNNVVKIHFQQGVSQKTWSKKELTDICTAFCAGMEASKLEPGFAQGGYVEHPFIAKIEAQLMQKHPDHHAEMEKVESSEVTKVKALIEPSEQQVKQIWGRLG